jgi:gas vesicle protein
MADGYDGFNKSLEYHEGSGGSFMMGLLTGTVLGAGLGMLFAPKSGTELRKNLSEQAGHVANTASEGYRRASEQAGQWAERGKDIYSKASEAVAKGADEAQKYVRDTASSYKNPEAPATGVGTGSTGTGYTAGSTYGGNSETIRGGSSEDGPSSTTRTPGSRRS